MVKNNQGNDANDKNLTNLDCITVNIDPNSDNEVSNKKYVDNGIDKKTILRFTKKVRIYLKVSVGNGTYKYRNEF